MTNNVESDQARNQKPPVAGFHDERIQLGYWYDILADIDVPTPETQPLPIDKNEDGLPEWDSQFAAEVVENLGGEAFVRADYKSAQMYLAEGSHIHEPTAEAVDRTVSELLLQQAMMQMPIGDQVYLREWLDLDWNTYGRETQHPEVRAFIRDGEVVCHHPRLEWRDSEAAGVVYEEQAQDIIDRHWNDEVRPLAERVAEAFEGEGWFSVDFVFTTDYRWYCTDMAVDALHCRDEEWQNISEHPGDCEHDLERHASALSDLEDEYDE